MRPRTNNILASVLIVILGFGDAKSIGEGRLKSKKSLVTESEGQDNLHNMLRSLVHKKKRSFHGLDNNGINPDWAEGYRISGLVGTNINNEDQYIRHNPISDNMVLDPEMSLEKQEAMKKMEVLSLIEAARSSGLPWDYYLSQMYKRSSASGSGNMNEDMINLTDLGDLGSYGYDDILNQPRLLDRETRDDGRRYLMWRKITG